MQQEDIRYVPVWSGWVRLTHWLMAAGWLFQVASAWVLRYGGAVDMDFWRDWHMICGQLLLVAVMGRIILMFILPGSAAWRAFLPDAATRDGVKQMLRFYLSFARTPLPNWYAHNPLWKLLYPIVFLLLLGVSLTGLFYNAPYTVAGIFLHQWHGMLASILDWLVVAHVIAVFLHDLKGKGAGISGMISGFRYFHVPAGARKPEQGSPFKGSTPPVYVSLDSIRKLSDKG